MLDNIELGQVKAQIMQDFSVLTYRLEQKIKDRILCEIEEYLIDEIMTRLKKESIQDNP
jgi:hypothetical protein